MSTGKPDQEKVEIIMEKLGHIVRAHIRAARSSPSSTPEPGRVVEAAREALNAMASVAALTVSGCPSSTGLFDFFLDAFRMQIAANIAHKMNPQPKKEG